MLGADKFGAYYKFPNDGGEFNVYNCGGESCDNKGGPKPINEGLVKLGT